MSDRITALGVPCKHKRRSRICVLAPLDVLRPGTRKGTTRHGYREPFLMSASPSTKTTIRESDIERKQKSRMVSFRVAEDDFIRLDALALQTSCSRAEVLRRCLWGARLKSTVDAQALHEVSRVHANLNRVGGLLKLAIREGVGDRAEHFRLNHELREAVREVSRAVERLAGLR